MISEAAGNMDWYLRDQFRRTRVVDRWIWKSGLAASMVTLETIEQPAIWGLRLADGLRCPVLSLDVALNELILTYERSFCFRSGRPFRAGN